MNLTTESGGNEMVLKGEFRCDCCGIADVETPFAHCDFCLQEYEIWLEKAVETTKQIREQEFQSYLKHENIAYSQNCYM